MLAITSVPTVSKFLNPDTFKRLVLLWIASKPGKKENDSLMNKAKGRGNSSGPGPTQDAAL